MGDEKCTNGTHHKISLMEHYICLGPMMMIPIYFHDLWTCDGNGDGNKHGMGNMGHSDDLSKIIHMTHTQFYSQCYHKPTNTRKFNVHLEVHDEIEVESVHQGPFRLSKRLQQ